MRMKVCKRVVQRFKASNPGWTQEQLEALDPLDFCCCGRPVEDKTKLQCGHCRQYGVDRAARLRKEAIDAYGGKCSCCAEANVIFLCIDHINGGGRQHRKQVGNKLYGWLKAQGYPAGFRVLCWNCNFAVYRCGGKCPHTT